MAEPRDNQDREVNRTIIEAARLSAQAKRTVDELVRLLTAHTAEGNRRG